MRPESVASHIGGADSTQTFGFSTIPRIFVVFAPLQAHLLHVRHQLLSLQPQVRQRKQHQHLRGVLGQAALARLDEPN